MKQTDFLLGLLQILFALDALRKRENIRINSPILRLPDFGWIPTVPMELRFMVTCVLKDLSTFYLLKAFAVFNNAPFSSKAPHVIVVLSNLYSGDLNDRVPHLFVCLFIFLFSFL